MIFVNVVIFTRFCAWLWTKFFCLYIGRCRHFSLRRCWKNDVTKKWFSAHEIQSLSQNQIIVDYHLSREHDTIDEQKYGLLSQCVFLNCFLYLDDFYVFSGSTCFLILPVIVSIFRSEGVGNIDIMLVSVFLIFLDRGIKIRNMLGLAITIQTNRPKQLMWRKRKHKKNSVHRLNEVSAKGVVYSTQSKSVWKACVGDVCPSDSCWICIEIFLAWISVIYTSYANRLAEDIISMSRCCASGSLPPKIGYATATCFL